MAAEYEVYTDYYLSDNARLVVKFDIDFMNSWLSLSQEAQANAIANAIADALEGLVATESGATGVTSTAKRYYNAVDNIPLT